MSPGVSRGSVPREGFGLYWDMLADTPRLRRFEADYQRGCYGSFSFREALARYELLWSEARFLNPDLGSTWTESLQDDLAVARAINGLPPG